MFRLDSLLIHIATHFSLNSFVFFGAFLAFLKNKLFHKNVHVYKFIERQTFTRASNVHSFAFDSLTFSIAWKSDWIDCKMKFALHDTISQDFVGNRPRAFGKIPTVIRCCCTAVFLFSTPIVSRRPDGAWKKGKSAFSHRCQRSLSERRSISWESLDRIKGVFHWMAKIFGAFHHQAVRMVRQVGGESDETPMLPNRARFAWNTCGMLFQRRIFRANDAHAPRWLPNTTLFRMEGNILETNFTFERAGRSACLLNLRVIYIYFGVSEANSVLAKYE